MWGGIAKYSEPTFEDNSTLDLTLYIYTYKADGTGEAPEISFVP